jgi:hypothetical protein
MKWLRKLLLVLTDTIVLGFGSRGQIFDRSKTVYMIGNGDVLFDERRDGLSE